MVKDKSFQIIFIIGCKESSFLIMRMEALSKNVII